MFLKAIKMTQNDPEYDSKKEYRPPKKLKSEDQSMEERLMKALELADEDQKPENGLPHSLDVSFILKDLESRLRQARTRVKKQRILRDVYKQLIPARGNRPPTPGIYRQYVESGLGDQLMLIYAVYQKLVYHQLSTLAQKLRKLYSLNDDWLESQNNH